MLARVGADLKSSREVLPGLRSAALITHLNETGGKLFGGGELAAFAGRFDRACISDCKWDAAPFSASR